MLLHLVGDLCGDISPEIPYDDDLIFAYYVVRARRKAVPIATSSSCFLFLHILTYQTIHTTTTVTAIANSTVSVGTNTAGTILPV